MQAADIVREARSSFSGLPSSQTLQLLMYQAESTSEDEDGYDPHADLRASVLTELHKTLSLKDRALIRFLLEQEIVCRQNETETDSDSIHLCGFLLFLLGQPEDIELLWQAKKATFDTWCGFDIQFLVGAGVAPTLAALQSIEKEWAEEARTYIEECQRAGDFGNLESYRHEKQRYFDM